MAVSQHVHLHTNGNAQLEQHITVQQSRQQYLGVQELQLGTPDRRQAQAFTNQHCSHKEHKPT